IAFQLGSKWFSLKTVHEGLEHTVEASGDQLRDKTFVIKTRPTNEPNGTRVKVTIPDHYTDINGDQHQINFYDQPSFTYKPLFAPVEIIQNGETLPMGIHQAGWNRESTLMFSWGEVHVYIDPKRKSSSNFLIHSAGLYQFDVDEYQVFGYKNPIAIPHNFVLDIRPYVDTKSPAYPFNNQREGFRSTIEGDIAMMWKYFNDLGAMQQLLMAKDVFEKDLRSMPIIEHPNLDLTPEQEKQVKELNRPKPKPPKSKKATHAAQGVPKSSTAVDVRAPISSTRGAGDQGKREYVPGSIRPPQDVSKAEIDVTN